MTDGSIWICEACGAINQSNFLNCMTCAASRKNHDYRRIKECSIQYQNGIHLNNHENDLDER